MTTSRRIGGTTNEVTVTITDTGAVDELVIGYRQDGEFRELASRSPPATVELYNHDESLR